MTAREFYQIALQELPYISFEFEVVEQFLKEGELLTDKELERMKLNNVKRDWPETSKVKVYGEDVYFNFGVRFAAVIQEVIQENNGNK